MPCKEYKERKCVCTFPAKYRLTKFLTFPMTTALQRLQIELLRPRGGKGMSALLRGLTPPISSSNYGVPIGSSMPLQRQSAPRQGTTRRTRTSILYALFSPVSSVNSENLRNARTLARASLQIGKQVRPVFQCFRESTRRFCGIKVSYEP